MAKFWTRDDILPKNEVVLYEGKARDRFNRETEIIVTYLRVLLIGENDVNNFCTKSINKFEMAQQGALQHL